MFFQVHPSLVANVMSPLLYALAALTASSVLGAQTRIDDALPPMFKGRIKHVIALRLENRSFAHMLGYLRLNRSDIDGCLPSMGATCSNPINPADASSPEILVGDGAIYVQPGDPCHSTSCTSEQTYDVFGDNEQNYYPPPMKGFVHSYAARDKFGHLNCPA